jgi:hypothetical protein
LTLPPPSQEKKKKEKEASMLEFPEPPPWRLETDLHRCLVFLPCSLFRGRNVLPLCFFGGGLFLVCWRCWGLNSGLFIWWF